jgi:hypothetical protein
MGMKVSVVIRYGGRYDERDWILYLDERPVKKLQPWMFGKDEHGNYFDCLNCRFYYTHNQKVKITKVIALEEIS